MASLKVYIIVVLLFCSGCLLVNAYPLDRNAVENDLTFTMPESEMEVPDVCKNNVACEDTTSTIAAINLNYKLFSLYQGEMTGFDMYQPKRSHRVRRGAYNTGNWPKSSDGLIYIPYVIFDPKLTGLGQRIAYNLMKAAEAFANDTCYRLIPRTIETDFVAIVDQNGCWSHVTKLGKIQRVSLSQGCEERDIIIHEFMHTIGFVHEHSRIDRDKYVKIIWNNIQKSYYDQFKKNMYGEIFVHGQEYDIHSIMHYGRRLAPINRNKDTMVPINPSETLGAKKGTGFSERDKKELNYKGMCGVNVKVHDARGY